MTTKFSTDNHWNKTLGALEYFSAPVFTRSGLYFKGEINVDRFLNAMKESFNDFNFILSTFSKNENAILVSSYPPLVENKYPLDQQLEIADRKEESVFDVNFDSVLPNLILDDRMKPGFATDLVNLPMGAFKLNIFKDGFVFGYSLNHTLFDHAGIFYYLKYLSHLYTYGRGNKFQLKKPTIVDTGSYSSNEIFFKDIQEVRKYGEDVLGFVHGLTSTKVSSASESTTIKLKLNLNEIDKLKSSITGQYLSKNDIIHAILFKLYCFNNKLSIEDEFCLRYAVNIRKQLGLGDEVVGNLVHQCKIVLTVGQVREKSLLDLAIINRKSVSEINGDHFKRDFSFYKYLFNNNINTMEYIGTGGDLTTRTTNWTNFDYNSIVFDESIPFALKSPCIASYGVDVISFDTIGSEKFYTCPISIPIQCLNLTIEYGIQTKLFTIEQL